MKYEICHFLLFYQVRYSLFEKVVLFAFLLICDKNCASLLYCKGGSVFIWKSYYLFSLSLFFTLLMETATVSYFRQTLPFNLKRTYVGRIVIFFLVFVKQQLLIFKSYSLLSFSQYICKKIDNFSCFVRRKMPLFINLIIYCLSLFS